jgi:transcriptional regulator with XRE-family HTH domain
MVTSLHHRRYDKLRSVLKDVRKNAGLTQVQLAELLHMEQSNLSKIERGERFVDTLLFIDFCKACGAVPAEVIAKVDDSDGQAC